MLDVRNNDELTETTLPGGLRMVWRRGDAAVEYFGVAIAAGSRDELPGEEGLAHFVEHTIFKGTARRRAWHILNRMEAVGGELNAYTTKEETLVYTVAPSGHLDRAAELVADLITSSRFPEAELRKEREVVIDEINSYLDTPAERVFDDFDDLFFRGSSLGHNILGSVESVRRFGSDDCLRWIERHYTLSRMVIFYMGPAPMTTVERIMARRFKDIRPTTTPLCRGTVVENAPFHHRPSDTNATYHQAHTVMGAHIPGIYSPDRHAVALLCNIIGGPGMNSLLNLELRERRGLVYSVDSSTALYSDSGVLSIYYGCDPDDNARCHRLVNATLRRIAEHGITPRQLESAKRQYAGQLILSAQNRENVALATARAALYGLKVNTTDQIVNAVMSLTDKSLEPLYPLLSPARFSTLTLT